MACALWKPLTLFRLGTVPVQIHTTFLIYPIGIITWDGYIEDASPGLLRALIFMFVFSVSLLVHEFAHVLSARYYGICTSRVLLFPLGAVADLESMPRGWGEFWIALAGPLSSFTLAGVFWLALHAMGSPIKDWLYDRSCLLELRYILEFGYALNLLVAGFNLLPCFPMDGGRVLRSGLAVFIGRVFPQHAGQAFLIATRIAVRYVAWLVALGMMAWTIIHSRIWLDLVLFPLLVLCAEAEYWVLRTDERPSESDDQ
jgi:stage IV sporulation protein FB